MKYFGWGVWVAVVSLCGGASLGALPAWADAADDVRVLRARQVAAAGDCRGALAIVGEVGDAAHAGAAHLRGYCALQEQDFVRAVEELTRAKTSAPDLPGIDLDLAMARYHVGDLDGARESIEAASATSADKAEFHLYRGLLLLGPGGSPDSAAGIAAINEARRLGGPESITSYIEGTEALRSADRAAADEAFDRVGELAPGTKWSKAAAELQAKMRRGGTPTRWGFARVGIEFDDNVVLRGEGVRLADEIGRDDDTRAVLILHGGQQLLAGENWSGGVTGTYYGSAHFELDDFNEHYPLLGLWLDRRIGEASTLRFRYDVGHAWVDGDPFLWSHEFTAAFFHDWAEAGRTKVFGTLYKYNYLFDTFDEVEAVGPLCLASRCGPAGVDESRLRNRDGWGYIAGVDHLWRIGALETEATTGLRWHRYDSRGTEYDYSGPELWLATETQLPWDLEFRTQISWMDLDFRNPSTYPRQLPPPGATFIPMTTDRDDERIRALAELEWFFARRWSLLGRYTWTDNDSNVGVFDYDRWGVGIYVTYRFEEPLTP